MIKLATLLKRGPHLNREQFAARWLRVHAPKAAVFPGLLGYMLGFSIEDQEPAADGIAQLWFDSRAAAQASYASEIGRQGSADAKAHLARRDLLLASEHRHRSGCALAELPFKLVVLAKRPVGADRGAFVGWFRGEALPGLADAIGAANARISLDKAGQLLNSGTAGALDLVNGEAVLDAMLELWLASEGDGSAALARVRDEELPRIAGRVGATETAILYEHVVVPPSPSAYGLPSGSET